MKIKFSHAVSDYSEIFRRAVCECRDGETIELETGIYPVSGMDSEKESYYLFNNDFAEKKIAFHIKNKKNLTIKGNGATLLFTDCISGFGIVGSENIEISDLKIDYAENYHFELEVEEVFEDRVKVKKRDGFEFTVANGEIFTPFGKLAECLCMAFDQKTNAPCYRQRFLFVDFSEGATKKRGRIAAKISEEEDGYYLKTEWAERLYKGAVLVICYLHRRYNQAIFMTDSKNVTVGNVDIRYSPSMGITAQLTENITLENVNVESCGGHGMLSTVCDATHFVHCGGKLTMKNCRFFNMMDDATNVHGVYLVVKRAEKNEIDAETIHFQQYGVNMFSEGDTVTVYKKRTADVRCRLKVTKSRIAAENIVALRVEGSAEDVEVGDFVCNYERMPEVEIENVKCGNNRPRGFLLTSPKKTVVRNCEFSDSEHGIELSGDTNCWYESGCCNDVIVENCIFKNCNHADGDYAVRICPVFDDEGEEKYYHKNVTVRNNTFIGFQNGMVYARSVKNLAIYGNRFIRDNTYPARAVKNGKLDLKDCAVSATSFNVDTEELCRQLAPVWLGNRIEEETAVFVGEDDRAPLLFEADGEITLTDFERRKTYREGEDYLVKGKELIRLAGDTPYYTQTEFYRDQPDVINVGVDKNKLSFPDGKRRYFKFGDIHEKTVRISYRTAEKTDIFGLNGKKGCCGRFIEKLRKNMSATILFYGDSITEGANASAQLGVSPYQEIWPVMISEFLKYYYRCDKLRYVNTAVGGKDSVWGLNNFDERVLSYSPDLLVLAFGMNDGGKSEECYESLIDGMLKKLKAASPECEIMLVATSVPNPESTWYGNQHIFVRALERLSEKYGGLPLLDMTKLTETLYGENGLIRYRDFTGNNVNHPNDFGVRLYAQAFLNELMGEEYRKFFDTDGEKS